MGRLQTSMNDYKKTELAWGRGASHLHHHDRSVLPHCSSGARDVIPVPVPWLHKASDQTNLKSPQLCQPGLTFSFTLQWMSGMGGTQFVCATLARDISGTLDSYKWKNFSDSWNRSKGHVTQPPQCRWAETCVPHATTQDERRHWEYVSQMLESLENVFRLIESGTNNKAIINFRTS